MAEKFIIQDWAGNRMFPQNTFASFDDGWDFIRENVDNSEYDKTGNENDNAYQEIFTSQNYNRDSFVNVVNDEAKRLVKQHMTISDATGIEMYAEQELNHALYSCYLLTFDTAALEEFYRTSICRSRFLRKKFNEWLSELKSDSMLTIEQLQERAMKSWDRSYAA